MPGNYRTSGALTPRHATVGRRFDDCDLNCGIGTVVALWKRRYCGLKGEKNETYFRLTEKGLEAKKSPVPTGRVGLKAKK